MQSATCCTIFLMKYWVGAMMHTAKLFEKHNAV